MFTNIVVAFALLSQALAQSEYYIDPTTVTQANRDYWCQQQLTQCPLICLQTSARSSETRQNDCDADTLSYACVCSNGLSPNLTQYSQTVPFFECQEWGNQCVDACTGDSACQSACREDHPCGAQNPRLANNSVTSTSPSSGPSGTQSAGGAGQTVYNGFADGSGDQPEEGGVGNLRVPAFVEVGIPLTLAMLFFGFAAIL